MNIAAMHEEDSVIEQLKKRVANLERSNTLLKRSKEEVDQHRDMHSIDETCRRMNVSKPTFYALQKKGLAPRLTRLKGTRRQFVMDVDLQDWLSNEKNFIHNELCDGVKRKALSPE